MIKKVEDLKSGTSKSHTVAIFQFF